MDSNEILAVINRIANTRSRLEKERILKEHITNKQFQHVLTMTLDSAITFGIADLPQRVESGVGVFDNLTWSTLWSLAHRNLTGNAARDVVQLELDRLSEDSAELLRRILLKDLRAGLGAALVNKVMPGLVETYPYMRCCLPKDANLQGFDWDAGVLSQEKADGMFINADVFLSGKVQLYSRQGSRFGHFTLDPLFKEVAKLLRGGTQTHGELLVRRAGQILPREQSNGLLNHVLQGGALEPDDVVEFYVWDQIPLEAVKDRGRYERPYAERFDDLKRQVQAGDQSVVRLIPTLIVHSLEEAEAHYHGMLAEGKEGTIVKNPHAVWQDGTSKEQVKFKLEVDVDLYVVGFNPGEGKNAATFGSIIVRSADDELEVAVSGFTDARRQELWANRESLLGRIVTVRANAIMYAANEGEKHSLFLPRWVEERLDKQEADSFQQVKDQFNAAARPGSRPQSSCLRA